MKKKVSGSGKPKRRRTVVTPHLRKEAIVLIKAGKTASIVANAVKVSVATVHNIKKAAGLTKPRKAKAAKKVRKK
jgi:DNA invertase Pin-like site-specific DNA recombinase